MKQKPLIFIVIAILHILEPLFKIAYFKATTHFPWTEIFSNIMALDGIKNIFDFWLLFPIAGIALLGVKKWSYSVFVSVQVYSIYTHFSYESYSWPYVAASPHWVSMALLAFNILIITYFLLPDVRRPFFDVNLRWWERKTRHALNIPCTLSFENPNILEDCHILNISETGSFLDFTKRDAADYQSHQPLMLHFSFKEFNVSLHAHVMSVHEFLGAKGIGIRFDFENIWERIYVRKVVATIAKEIRRQTKEGKNGPFDKMAA